MAERISEEPKREISKEEFEGALKEFDKGEFGYIMLAAMARDAGAKSWRNFFVGCSVASLRMDNYVIQHDFDANIKEAEGPKKPTDKCAERRTLEKALRRSPDAILGIVTVSDKVSTEDNPNVSSHDVLHPCGDCQNLFRDLLNSGVLRPETRLVMVRDKGKQMDKIDGLEDIQKFVTKFQFESIKRTSVGELLHSYK